MKKIIIIGGGPSGSLTAILLRRKAEAAGLDINVKVLEAKPFKESGVRGCNYCAGVITSRTLSRFKAMDMELPPGVVQRRIDGFFYVTEGGSVDFSRPGKGHIYTVFRGGGPRNKTNSSEDSFDRFLLHKSREFGVVTERKRVTNVFRRNARSITVQYDDGEEDADLVVGAFGVNSPLIPQLTKNLGYIPPETVKVAQTEVAMDNDYIDGFYGNRILAFAIKDPKIRFLAVTPKKNYLTLTAVGNDISLKDLRAYIKRNRVLRFINEDYSGELVGCHCHPRMPIGMAKGAVSDRFVVVGDAFASRFYKNGLGSAHYTAIKAAEAIIQNGYKKKYLAPVYGRAIRKRFGWSNRWGKLLFYINDFTYKTPWMARATIDYVQRERERMDVGPVNALMWSLFTGDRSYSRLVRKAFNPFLLLRMFIWYIRYAILGIGRWMTSTIKAR